MFFIVLPMQYLIRICIFIAYQMSSIVWSGQDFNYQPCISAQPTVRFAGAMIGQDKTKDEQAFCAVGTKSHPLKVRDATTGNGARRGEYKWVINLLFLILFISLH